MSTSMCMCHARVLFLDDFQGADGRTRAEQQGGDERLPSCVRLRFTSTVFVRILESERKNLCSTICFWKIKTDMAEFCFFLETEVAISINESLSSKHRSLLGEQQPFFPIRSAKYGT